MNKTPSNSGLSLVVPIDARSPHRFGSIGTSSTDQHGSSALCPQVQWGLSHRTLNQLWAGVRNRRGARTGTRDCNNKVQDCSERLLSQDCKRAQPPPTLCVCPGPVRCGLRARPRSLFVSRGTAAGAPALTLSGGRDRLEEGRGRSAGAGQPKFPGFPAEQRCGDPVYNPLVTRPGPAPRLPVRVLASDLCSKQGPCSWGPAPHLTSRSTRRSPGPVPVNRLRKVESASRAAAPAHGERNS